MLTIPAITTPPDGSGHTCLICDSQSISTSVTDGAERSSPQLKALDTNGMAEVRTKRCGVAAKLSSIAIVEPVFHWIVLLIAPDVSTKDIAG